MENAGADPDMEAVRRGYDHGRYIALMNLNHFLGNENVEALLPAAEVVLNQPITVVGRTVDSNGSTMVEVPTTSTRHLVVDQVGTEATPPAPPLPRLMKNLLKDRRRFQRQLVTSNPVQQPQPRPADVERNIVEAAHRNMENFLLKELFENELKEERSEASAEFTRELLFSTLTQDVPSKKD